MIFKYGKLFLSYAPEDILVVRSFSKDLKRAGVNIWFDEEEIGDEDNPIEKVTGALINCLGFYHFNLNITGIARLHSSSINILVT